MSTLDADDWDKQRPLMDAARGRETEQYTFPPDNKIVYQQDFGAFQGIPSDVVFEKTGEVNGLAKLCASGYGKTGAYGNGAIYVRLEDMPAAHPRDTTPIDAHIPPSGETQGVGGRPKFVEAYGTGWNPYRVIWRTATDPNPYIDALEAALTAEKQRAEAAEYELKRFKEANAARPDFERLWDEAVERAEAAEKRLAVITEFVQPRPIRDEFTAEDDDCEHQRGYADAHADLLGILSGENPAFPDFLSPPEDDNKLARRHLEVHETEDDSQWSAEEMDDMYHAAMRVLRKHLGGE